jgi:hypothetical protein
MLNNFLPKVCTLLLIIVAAVSASAQTNVTTERYDDLRTGANLSETSLNTSNVNVAQFGKLFSYSIDGSVQAQPLYISSVAIPGQGTHNVLYVATMNDVLYALDADSSNSNGGVLWSKDFRNSAAGVTAIPIVDIVGSNVRNIVGNVGIESTPSIDLTTNTLYLVARTKEVSGSVTNYVPRLHAIDITTGDEKFGGPTVIQASVPGVGNGSSGGVLNFDPKNQNQRSSLALVNGSVLFSWASHEDLFIWHGWVFAYNAQTLQQSGVFCSSPNGLESGIWMAGRAPVVDSNGYVYYTTGNGDYNVGSNDYGDSVLKLNTAGGGLSVVDWFTPDDFQSLQASDLDLGSTGPVLIPGTDLLVTSGKESIIYVMHTSNLGHEQTGNNQIVQHFPTTGGEIKGGLAMWNRTSGTGPTMYVWPDNIRLQAYHFNGSTLDTTPISQSTIVAPTGNSGGVLTISANGSTPGTGIVWSSMPSTDDSDHGVHQGVLRAFDANNLTTELWDSTMNSSRDDMGLWPKFSPPTVVNGKVYMASFSDVLNVYGVFAQNPDFAVSGTPAAQSVAPGGSTTYTVSTTSQRGFNASVTLNVNGLPSGATASFSPASIPTPGTSMLTVNTTTATPLGTYTLTLSGTGGGSTRTSSIFLNVATAGQGSDVISINFVGPGTAMASTEVAGVVAKSNWNNATGSTSTNSLSLFNESGNATSGTVIWKSDNVWSLPITDQPGNARMMKGYLDTGSGNTTTVTVDGLPANSNGYNIYVYADGDNGSATRSATYEINGPGLTTPIVHLTDPPNANFSNAFTQANNSSGNYVLFTNVNASSFTISAIPGATSDRPRAPVNGIQIVPLGSVGPAPPDFTLSATPTSASVTQGNSTNYTVSTGAVNGFGGTVNLNVNGVPSGATVSFNPTSIVAGASSTLTVTTSASTPVGSSTLTVTGSSGSLSHAATVTLHVSSSSGSSSSVIGIDFVGFSAAAMGASEVAGVVPKFNWNSAAGSSGNGLVLVDETGTATGATVTWSAAGIFKLPIADTAGDFRMMNGYLDPIGGNGTVTVTGLPSNAAGYDVYVYADGSNGAATRNGTYQISGTGITTTSINLIDPPNTNFSGTYTQANSSNGNYVKFTITGTDFTVTAMPGAGSDGIKRAPVNGIQIVAHATTPDFTISASPSSQTVTAGGSTTYTVSVGAVNGFAGAVMLSASGLPNGATASFVPATVSGGGTSTLTVTTGSTTPTGTSMVTVTGTSGSLTHAATTSLVVSGAPDFSISATPATQAVTEGSSTTYTLTIGAVNGFAGTVTLSANGLPTGATASFVPTTVSGGGTSTLTVTTGSTTPTGTSMLTITGTSGSLTHTATTNLAVTDFTISASPASQSVTAGSSTTYTVTIGAVNGFAGMVTLSASGLPTGATAGFAPPTTNGGGTSRLTVTTGSATPIGSYTLTVTGSSGSLAHSAGVTLVVSTAVSGPRVISVQFVGSGAPMASTEVAGVIAKSNWNRPQVGTPNSSLALVDETGASTGAIVTWTSDNLFNLNIVDQAGNFRMMRGYLDDRFGSPTTVTVSGLPSNANGYDVYVYADGSNRSASRTGNYQISGTGITTTTVSLTDAPNTDFSGTFTQANNSNGNYVKFTVNAMGFKLTATPGAASDGTPRSPVNAIQIVPR